MSYDFRKCPVSIVWSDEQEGYVAQLTASDGKVATAIADTRKEAFDALMYVCTPLGRM